MHKCEFPQMLEEVVGSPGTRVIGACGYCEPNWGTQPEQQALLTSLALLQLPTHVLSLLLDHMGFILYLYSHILMGNNDIKSQYLTLLYTLCNYILE